MTKHEEILKYINSLEVGTKVSVRSVAYDLGVSEGTAYRAIKDAEIAGIVSTIPRVGTVRIEKIEKKSIETLTFGEVVNIVDGVVLGGREGLHKPLNKFVIGAMTVDAMTKYISPGNLLIVGNREEAQKLALENGSGVLITGGFDCSNDIKSIANEMKLPIISSSYDTFTTATMINKAISERLIKKDIILVEDIMNTNPVCLYTTDTVKRCREVMKETGLGKFPVLDDKDKLVGVIISRDLSAGIRDDDTIGRVMVKNPTAVMEKASVAYVAHLMAWDSLELIPVVEDKNLVGIVSRSDVLKALQNISKQPHISETFEDIIIKNFSYQYSAEGMTISGKVIPEMYNPLGSVSLSSLTTLMTLACTMALRHKNHNTFVDSFTSYYIKPVQIDSSILIQARVLGSARNFAKVEVEMMDGGGDLCAKGMLSAKIIKNK